MPLSLPYLQQVIVDQWRVLSLDRWTQLASQFPDADSIVAHLFQEPRFRIARGNVNYITADQRLVLYSGSPSDLLVQLQSDRWLKLQELPSGGQGEVWLASPCNPDAREKDLVALKSPRPGRPTAFAALQREIEILQQITCDYIAPLVDSDHAVATLATRFIDGPSLENKVSDERRMSIVRAMQAGIDICRALYDLHALNWIHKDVKPGNVVLDASGRAVLIDFGLAEDPAIAATRAGGTPHYMAPEVFFELQTADERADLYSLAATLYRLISGQPPHFRDCLDPWNYRASRLQLDALKFGLSDASTECDLEELRQEVPHQLAHLVARTLAADRNERPRFATDFCLELEQILARIEVAKALEKELWNLAEVLLQAYRAVHVDADYPGKESANASALRNDLTSALPSFPALEALRRSKDSWTDFPAAHAIVPKTIKIRTKIETLCKQLDAFLARRPAIRRQQEWADLLKDLVVRTLQGVQSLGVDAVSAAHAWRTVLLELGAVTE